MGSQAEFLDQSPAPNPAAPGGPQARDRYAKAVVKTFDAVAYTATIQLIGSVSAYLEGVAVSRAIPAAEMTAGRYVLVTLFGSLNPLNAAVVGVWT
jgi:hypothetical protein